MNSTISARESWQFTCCLKGLFWAISLTLLFSFLFSLLFQYTPLSESLLPSVSTFIFFMSMLLGATTAAYSAGHKGLLHSTAVSFTYFLLSLLFCFLLLSNPFSFFFKKISLTIVSSFLGGVLGIGLRPH